jgi:hypothetical protein
MYLAWWRPIKKVETCSTIKQSHSVYRYYVIINLEHNGMINFKT